MADAVELLSSDNFDVAIGDIKEIIVKEVSGMSVDMSPKGADNAIGSGPKGKSLVLSVPSQPKYGEITLVLVPGAHQGGNDDKLWEWYKDCASKANLGEAAKARTLRKEMTINVYYSGSEGKVGLTYSFVGVLPNSFDVPKRDAGSSELETWTLKLNYERMKFTVSA